MTSALRGLRYKKSPKNRLELGRGRSSGFGVVRMNKRKGTLVAEAWPVDVDPRQPGAKQYPGWPVTVTVADCVGSGNPTLPPVVLLDWEDQPLPVVEVRDADGQIVTVVRMTEKTLSPRVFDPEGVYTVNVILPESDGGRLVKRFRGVSPKHSRKLLVKFEG